MGNQRRKRTDDPGNPEGPPGHDPMAKALALAQLGREAALGNGLDEDVVRGSSFDDVPVTEHDLSVALGAIDMALQRCQFRSALDQIGMLKTSLPDEPLLQALTAWAYAGVGDVERSESLLLRAELHAARATWCVESTLRRVRAFVAAAKREAKERADAAQRMRALEATRATGPRGLRKKRAKPKKQSANKNDTRPILPTPTVSLDFVLTARSSAPDLDPNQAAAGPESVDPEIALADYRLRNFAIRINELRQYDTLLSLGVARGVDRYEYQFRTVRRVLRDFRGRALLADEVGLGKTIEACLCLEEYLQRGLAQRILLLVPPGLLTQWRDELEGKFGRTAFVTSGDLARKDPGLWTREPLVLASMALARSEPHASRIVDAGFDMVIVDEAHKLKNRRTLLWRLVDRIRARYLLLLSATPVENNLIEIYNVLCLLRPGLFSTKADFKKRFVTPGKRTPKDPQALRALLRQVMIRNTRAGADANLPPRFASTLRAEPGPDEAAFRTRLDIAIRARLAEGTLSRLRAGEILRASGARPPAAARLIERYLGGELGEAARGLVTAAKDDVLIDLLQRRPDDKVIVFASHLDSVAHIVDVATRAGRRPIAFHGSLSPTDKAKVVETFRDSADVLVATDSGGEGFNMHFARTVVNYDLPWNPMRIEQRIGRVHRIGQTRDVFVFNLVSGGSIEEEILRVLDEKIDMFELVVGEVEAILGRLGDDEREFSDLVLEIYAETEDATQMRERFDVLAETMVKARSKHLKAVELDAEIFGTELEV